MEIRNLTPEQIEEAMEKASAKYGGNLYLKSTSARVKLAEPYTTEHTYTRDAHWSVMRSYVRPADASPEDWRETDFYPYINTLGLTVLQIEQIQRQLCEEEMERLRKQDEYYFDALPTTYYKVEWIPEHEVTHTTQHTHEYKFVNHLALNKKGTRYRVWPGVKSSRRPGSRVSPERPIIDSKPRRIASACWHAHRDFYRECFKINPDAVIITALARYNGSEHFEDTFPSTAHAGGGPFGYPVVGIAESCNCDEGIYGEYAIEGLTPEQYDDRISAWEEYPAYCNVKAPKRENAITQ